MPSVNKFFLASLSFILGATSVLAQSNCGPGNICGDSAPCCSEFGFCGSDHCLAGCNPLWSNTPDSCRPTPLCVDKTYTFKDSSRILSNVTQYDGNATAWDWTVDKGNIYNTGNELALLLTKDNGGTRISSTHYVHYGTITATMKTGRWNGVVTAFITMSDAKDEIDWEWPGAKTTSAQSNFFWLGVVPADTHGATHDGLSDTYSNYHDYTIDWQPDQLQFLIDGKVVRTVTKDSTTNGAAGRSEYPTTPARIEISLWPAGIAGTPQGTIDWAGGMIDWNDPDYTAAGGHFAAQVKSVTVKCTKESGPAVANATSYVYGANQTNGMPSVKITNHTTLLNGAVGGIATAGGAMWMAGAMAISVALGMSVLA